jgi:putative polyhydroxyalkanoate system protein
MDPGRFSVSKTITVTLPHRLTQDQARQRIQDGIADLRRTHGSKLAGVQEQWTGNRLDFQLQAMGQHISGRVDVLPEHVRIDVDLPWMLAMLAGGFKQRVEAEGRKLLEQK